MKLSNQALGAIMMALQKSLLEQTDIVPVLKGLTFRAIPWGISSKKPNLRSKSLKARRRHKNYNRV